jgi:hypothetical protein
MVSPVLTLKTAGEERNNACSPQLPMPYHPDSLYPRYTPNGQVSGVSSGASNPGSGSIGCTADVRSR